MSFKKLALTTAVAAAMGATAVPSYAMVYGVAGEALLVPLVLTDPANPGVQNTNTYVVLRTPTILGSDFVLNNYTTPNLRRNVANDTAITLNPQPPYGWQIHWTWFDPESKNPINDTCEASPNDVVIWTTDQDLLDIQQDIDRGIVQTGGLPMTFCGDSTLPPAGYVVFQTGKGADGLEANFAMEGTAYITDNDITEYPVGLLSVPVIPMSDGEDPDQADASTSPRIGANEVIQPGTAKGQTQGIGTYPSPIVVSPVATGVRMNNGNPNTPIRSTALSGGVQGDYMVDQKGQPASGYSMHVLWFDRNNPGRGAAGQSFLYDEHERGRSFKPPVDRELNILLFNASLQFGKQGFQPDPWGVVNPNHAKLQWVDLIRALEAAQTDQAYANGTFPAPAYWDWTIMGFMEYVLKEEGTELGGPNGTTGANASMVAFEAQEDALNADAWSQHLMTVRGFRGG